MAELDLPPLARTHVADTGVWIWVRDRRFPQLRSWFDAQVREGRIAVCAPIVLELVRGAPNPDAAARSAGRLRILRHVPCGDEAWTRAGVLQLELSRSGEHRRTPVTDLVIAAACEIAGVPVLHHDADFERIAAVGTLEHRWLAPPGALA